MAFPVFPKRVLILYPVFESGLSRKVLSDNFQRAVLDLNTVAAIDVVRDTNEGLQCVERTLVRDVLSLSEEKLSDTSHPPLTPPQYDVIIMTEETRTAMSGMEFISIANDLQESQNKPQPWSCIIFGSEKAQTKFLGSLDDSNRYIVNSTFSTTKDIPTFSDFMRCLFGFFNPHDGEDPCYSSSEEVDNSSADAMHHDDPLGFELLMEHATESMSPDMRSRAAHRQAPAATSSAAAAAASDGCSQAAAEATATIHDGPLSPGDFPFSPSKMSFSPLNALPLQQTNATKV
jgi:hypothetical protein